MRNIRFMRYYRLTCIGMLLASCYPLWMGVRVVCELLQNRMVEQEHYPKYLIPYTPIAIAVILAVVLMPLFVRRCKRLAFVGGAGTAVGVFFITEWLFEKTVVYSGGLTTELEDWQMFMCYIPPEGVSPIKTQTAVDILMGDYNPAFKLHFYVISVVLILAILNCLYGFGQALLNDDNVRCKSLAVQSVCTAVFLALCILACFTAFWRDGNLDVSPLSAVLMSVFFILLGVTAGAFVGSFLLRKRPALSICLSSVTASIMTLVMYVGEMILLNGHVYRYGEGVLFESLPLIVLAPVDLLIILAAGGITAVLQFYIQGRSLWKSK